MILEDLKEPSGNKTGHKTTRTIKFECDNCHVEFVRSGAKLDIRMISHKFHYCKIQCTYEHRRNTEGSYKAAPNKVEIECFNCKKKIERWKGNLNIFKHHFCNQKCRGAAVSSGIHEMNLVMTDEIKEKIGQKAKERYKIIKHPMLGKHHSEESKGKMSAEQLKSGRSKGDNNPMFGKNHSLEIRQKMSEIVSREILSGKRKAYGTNFHQKGDYFSAKANKTFHYRSSWERECMKWLDGNELVLTYDYENMRITYSYCEGSREHKRYYIPDFLITFSDSHKELWELKPKEFCDNLKTNSKKIAAENYCKENEIKVYRLLNRKDLVEMGILLNQASTTADLPAVL